jgi:hypothetical protein
MLAYGQAQRQQLVTMSGSQAVERQRCLDAMDAVFFETAQVKE